MSNFIEAWQLLAARDKIQKLLLLQCRRILLHVPPVVKEAAASQSLAASAA